MTWCRDIADQSISQRRDVEIGVVVDARSRFVVRRCSGRRTGRPFLAMKQEA